MKVKYYKRIKKVHSFSEALRDACLSLGFKEDKSIPIDTPMIQTIPLIRKGNKLYFKFKIFKDKYCTKQVGYIEMNINEFMNNQNKVIRRIKKVANRMLDYHRLRRI